jgi:hypothetical protein
MKNRTDREMVRAFKHLHAYLCDRSLRPKMQKLDNEASAALQHAMREEAIDYQQVPPHVHRRNAAKQAIRTFKAISLPAFAALTRTSRSNYGIACSLKPLPP